MTAELDRMREMHARGGLSAQHQVRTPVMEPARETTHSLAQRGANPLPIRRGFAAAEVDNLTWDWSMTPQTTYSLVTQQLTNLRARARVEARRNDYAVRAIGMIKNGVVGPDGFQLQCMFTDPGGTLDKVANQAFEDHWHRWAENPEAVDVRGHFDFAQLCNHLVGNLPTDGEFFLRRWRRGPMGIQYQVIEPMLLDVQHQDELPGGVTVRCGIELDPFLKPRAFYFSERTDYYYATGRRIRVPADEIIHGFIPIGIDQLRGLPWLSTPMMRMHMTNGYEEAAVVNARYGASKMGFITRGEERYRGATDAAGRPIEELTPGAIQELGPNDHFEGFSPDYPRGEFQDFVRQMLRGVASGLQLSYPTLANDLEGVNYNSLRHDALESRDVFMALQAWFKSVVLRRIYADWLVVQLARGVPIPRRAGGSRPANPARLDHYSQVRWQGRRWQWVDPAKEIAAAREALEMKVTSRAQIMRERGMDPETIWREVEEEETRFGPMQPKGAPSNGGDTGDPGNPDPTPDGDSEGSD